MKKHLFSKINLSPWLVPSGCPVCILSGDVCSDAQFGPSRVRPSIRLAGPEAVLGAEPMRTIPVRGCPC